MARPKEFCEVEVLEKAIELFWKKGFHATSIGDLVDYLGVSRASLYGTYGDKQALFEKALKRYSENSKKFITDFLSKYPSPKAGLVKLFEQSITHCVSDPDSKGCFVVNTTTELMPEDQVLRSRLVENKEEFEAAIQYYLQKGVEKGEISADKNLKSIASFIFTLYSGLNVVAKINSDKEELFQMIRTGLSILD